MDATAELVKVDFADKYAHDLMPAPHGAEDGALTGPYWWRENQCVSCTEGAPHHRQATHNAKSTKSVYAFGCARPTYAATLLDM